MGNTDVRVGVAGGAGGLARLTPPGVDFRLPPHLVEHFRTVGEELRVAKGTLLETEGTASRAFWVVLDGLLSIYATDPTGRQITLNTVLPGESVGETIVSAGVRTSSVRAEIDSDVLSVTVDEFIRALAMHSDFALLMVRRLAYLVRGLAGQVRQLALDDVYGRLIRLVLETSTFDGSVRTAPRLSYREISKRIGASRSMVNRIMNELVRGGYIEIAGSAFLVRKTLPDRW
jgi:CRP/FNR family cyclic AMP-dependent transcriptional regulator